MIEIGKHSRFKGWSKKPAQATMNIIIAAKAAVASVEYKTSLRWVFYRLWQAGDLAHVPATPSVSAKVNAYNRLKSVCSKAVHTGYLRPNWVADDTRHIIGRGGYHEVDEWIQSIKEDSCNLHWMLDQDHYVIVAFEAEAMAQQFAHYTRDYGIARMPMRGDPSNPYKYRIAKEIEWANAQFNAPVVVLYFGDLDEKGLSIPESAFSDIRGWAGRAKFTVYRVGLNPGDEITYNIPEVPGKLGAYQWEALDDDAAGKMITEAVEEFIDMEILEEIQEKEDDATKRVQETLDLIQWDEE